MLPFIDEEPSLGEFFQCFAYYDAELSAYVLVLQLLTPNFLKDSYGRGEGVLWLRMNKAFLHSLLPSCFTLCN